MLEPRDAVIVGLAELGHPEAPREDDVLRAKTTIARFRAARRRSRLRAVGVIACSVAAAIALTWWITPMLRGRGFEVIEGDFLVQQGHIEAGAKVPEGEWIEPGAARACLRVGVRRVCGEPGARMRVLDDERVELARGRLQADGELEVETPMGVVRSDASGLDVVLDADALTIAGPAVTLRRDGVDVELTPGARVGDAGAAAVVADAAPIVAPSIAPVDPPVAPIASPEPAPSDRPRALKPSPKPVASAGEMLAAARELASSNKLAAAATAYQRLLDTYPDSGEARAALVSLGRVQASRGRHAAALAAFSRYLGGGPGPLGEEASFGRVAALDALGRDADRDRAIAALESAHPNSVYLRKAHALAGK